MIYLAPTAVLSGDVTVEEGASVWHGAVLRGDFDSIVLGRDSNIQDNAVVHVDHGLPAVIGERVTVGHAAVVHACTVEDECLIGMNATINSGAIVRRGSLVASGAVVREMADFPPDSVIAGVPAKVVRNVDATLRRRIELSWTTYRELAKSNLPARAPVKGERSKRVPFELSGEYARLIREK
ncbi:MAG TPA: gamma carbonic anhydrase family protein [Thermoplasmata archaeon]|jgi:carbonic anhydrase/acetyltransferase-like protein (isoleucine patch superfamily)|nr:gamma carbonic anhydrase family protein [Thermoplasmata archaeon]